MSEASFAQKRQYYRLKYPKRARPVVRVQGDLYHVSEVSEKGIRVVVNQSSSFHQGFQLRGILDLHDESQVQIEGAILRLDNNEIIVQLTRGPSFKDMVQEQRHIRNKYPTYFAKLREYAA
ncbi:PilZ domain-containing protein [Vibrio sp. SCSIO 43135]|uniref:PilZ domain-containing protein n=1 Tax=Vibrio sp. SCSIO 43135 TaxID=2819096 RepID=UPI002074E5D7|nr:PilZ domain-containing protein [Vibrio sp. SCSIO 43135]USD40121.1 PilZ domain-containing protein [Vibrio sp. SCSIO 43135]